MDQKSRIATEEDVPGSWNGYKDGRRFRCYICGHKFKIGDRWRFVYAGDKGYINFFVCEKCDCENIKEIWIQRNKELKEKFWWALYDDME
jgi:hypothetical protein